MAITNFTVEAAMFTNAADAADEDDDAEMVGLVGDVYFEPVLGNEAIMAPDHDPPAGFRLRTIAGFFDSDGVLYASRSGEEGVRLWANDPALGLGSLRYRVTFNLTTPLGETVVIKPFYITAPDEDVTVNLSEAAE